MSTPLQPASPPLAAEAAAPVPSAARRVPAWKGMAVVALGASILGLSAIFVKWAVAGGATPTSVGTYRLLFALPAAFLLARREGGLGPATGRRWAILAGVLFFGDTWNWYSALGRTSAANATFITCGLCPIWVALFSVLAFDLRYRWLGWLGQAAGLAGALVLALANGARVGTGLGEAQALVASLFYAGFTLALSRSRRTLRASQALFWMSLACFLCFFVAALASGQPLAGYDGRAWASLVGLGIVVHVLAWWLNGWGLGHVDAAFGALGLQAQQVATLFLAAWLLAEPVRPLGLLGGALIVGGIAAVTFGPRRH